MTEPETPDELEKRERLLKRLLGPRSIKELLDLALPTFIEFYAGEGYLLRVGVEDADTTLLGLNLEPFEQARAMHIALSLKANLLKVWTLHGENLEVRPYLDYGNRQSEAFSNSLSVVRTIFEIIEKDLGRSSGRF